MAGGVTVTPLDEERRTVFTAIFGSPTVPVTSIQPEELVSNRKTSMVFYLDLNAITAEQRTRLELYLGRKYELTIDMVQYWLDLTGFFILAENVLIDFQP